ncbi:hypothetical protein AFLA70_57g003861 [Aspergillus flavus AF70]|nr:hypothetical protein AFLA70_57g003861 [Aspergillus flavus AF70]
MAKTLGKGPTSARLPIKKYSPYPHRIDSRLRYYAPRLGISAIIAIMRTWTAKESIASLTCRSRKVKCDERKPLCRNCERSRVVCIPSDLVSFRHWQHPSLSKHGYFGIWEPSQTWVEVRISVLDVTGCMNTKVLLCVSDEC